MKKYYVEITQATKKEERVILQSKWLNSKESARRWANNIEYADDNIHAYIMSAEWDTQEDTCGDIIQEENLSRLVAVKIKALNTSIYIDDLASTADGKIRVYDTNKNYLDYYEEITFQTEQEYLDEIKRLESVKTIEELLARFCLYENKDYVFVDDYEMGDTTNAIGDKTILFC